MRKPSLLACCSLLSLAGLAWMPAVSADSPFNMMNPSKWFNSRDSDDRYYRDRYYDRYGYGGGPWGYGGGPYGGGPWGYGGPYGGGPYGGGPWGYGGGPWGNNNNSNNAPPPPPPRLPE